MGDLGQVYLPEGRPTFLGGSSGAWRNERAFLVDKRRAEMFVTLSTYQARQGEEDAIIALHEDWQRHQQPHARGYLSGELLRNVMASREFVAIMRFENQEAAQALANDPERKIWYRRLVSLTEGISIRTEYTCEWQTS
jgi:antibiotic biosynthesis monooxygenase (ABM) superfamily enzyme